MTTANYIILKGPESLRKTDYCFDCGGLIVAGEPIYLIRFGNLPDKWGKVHETCAKNSPHWEIWEKSIKSFEKETRVIDLTIANYEIIVLPKGTYTQNKKYSVRKAGTDTQLYSTSREERARGVVEFLNQQSNPGV